jgi:hypothetical protein
MPAHKQMGRPRKQEQKMAERVIALFTEDERDRLVAIANEKHMSISVLVRTAIEKVYPQVFKESDKKK